MEETKITPMMRQYLQIKERYRDAILFFRLGDFYEMFFEDANIASRILDIALTSRNKNEDSAVPLCGVPYHSAEPYIQKLLEAGHRVAVCEQMEDPKNARGVVQREVVRVISPGTVTAVESLAPEGNNFLAAVFRSRESFGLALCDITTGEFHFTELEDEPSLLDEISRIRPSEILVANTHKPLQERLRKQLPSAFLTMVARESFSLTASERVGPEQAGSGDLQSNGIRAASAILGYLERNAPDSLKTLSDLKPYVVSHHLVLDAASRTHLELVSSFNGERSGSLLAVIDRTLTPMGARRLRRWLLYPLLDEIALRERHDAVQELVDNFSLRQELRETLRTIQDLERLSGRAASDNASPKDLAAIKETLRAAERFGAPLATVATPALQLVRTQMAPLPQVVDLIERGIVDHPPLGIKEGGFIRQGFDPELDELRSLRTDAKDWIAQFEVAEKRRTGITSLKVRYNRVFGYYIEVTKANLKSVPADYIRKQTLANGERYITPELKEYEAKILNCDQLIEKLEGELLVRIREQVARHYAAMKVMSDGLATLDAMVSLAEVAESNHYTRPRVDKGLAIAIREGRHPVVEQHLGRGAFVPNDALLDPASNQILLLTGPNMAGKSTYMRQVALIVILAQMGSFVPAAEARIGLVDRIFTRIGAADSLARGESTFMVEMKETANILHHATSRSLILLDEVGRGTSTFDGISIAWSVAETLHDCAARPRTLFATHYHELTELSRSRERIQNYNFAVKEWQGDVIFLRNLVQGAASHSYGIHVARLAGLPATVISRAKEILSQLEGDQGARENLGRATRGLEREAPVQMALFESADRKLLEMLKTIDVANLTPIEALNLLYKICEEAQK